MNRNIAAISFCSYKWKGDYSTTTSAGISRIKPSQKRENHSWISEKSKADKAKIRDAADLIAVATRQLEGVRYIGPDDLSDMIQELWDIHEHLDVERWRIVQE